MDELDNQSLPLYLILDDDLFPQFLEFAALEGWADLVIFLLESDFLRFKSNKLFEAGNDKSVSLFEPYVLLRRNKEGCFDPVLPRERMLALERLITSRIPLGCIYADICQAVWKTALARGGKIVSSPMWPSIRRSIVQQSGFKEQYHHQAQLEHAQSQQGYLGMEEVLNDPALRKFWDRSLRSEPRDLSCLQCLLGARRILQQLRAYKATGHQLATPLYARTSHTPAAASSSAGDPRGSGGTNSSTGGSSSIMRRWRASHMSVSSASKALRPSLTSSGALLGSMGGGLGSTGQGRARGGKKEAPSKAPTSAPALNAGASTSAGAGGKDVEAASARGGGGGDGAGDDMGAEVGNYSDPFEALRILLDGMRRLQRQFFPVNSTTPVLQPSSPPTALGTLHGSASSTSTPSHGHSLPHSLQPRSVPSSPRSASPSHGHSLPNSLQPRSVPSSDRSASSVGGAGGSATCAPASPTRSAARGAQAVQEAPIIPGSASRGSGDSSNRRAFFAVDAEESVGVGMGVVDGSGGRRSCASSTYSSRQSSPTTLSAAEDSDGARSPGRTPTTLRSSSPTVEGAPLGKGRGGGGGGGKGGGDSKSPPMQQHMGIAAAATDILDNRGGHQRSQGHHHPQQHSHPPPHHHHSQHHPHHPPHPHLHPPQLLRNCSGLSEPLRMEIASTLASNASVRTREIDEVDRAFAFACAAILERLLLSLQAETCSYARGLFAAFERGSDDYACMMAQLRGQQCQRIQQYCQKVDFLLERVQREKVVSWKDPEAAGKIYFAYGDARDSTLNDGSDSSSAGSDSRGGSGSGSEAEDGNDKGGGRSGNAPRGSKGIRSDEVAGGQRELFVSSGDSLSSQVCSPLRGVDLSADMSSMDSASASEKHSDTRGSDPDKGTGTPGAAYKGTLGASAPAGAGAGARAGMALPARRGISLMIDPSLGHEESSPPHTTTVTASGAGVSTSAEGGRAAASEEPASKKPIAKPSQRSASEGTGLAAQKELVAMSMEFCKLTTSNLYLILRFLVIYCIT